MKQTINILCATDSNYVPFCGIMLTSVFKSNKHTRVDAYILIDKPLPQKAQRRFAKLAEKYGNGIFYLLIDNSFFEKFPIKGMSYWSIATYYRLYASELLPDSVNRILYLDCDIIVNGALDYLWKIDMTNKAVGCIPDIYNYMGDFQRRLQYPVEAGYYNAGVLLINVDYWRRNAIGQQCLDFLTHHYDLIEANDQDVLNAVLWDKKMQLPLDYNFQIHFLEHFFYDQYDAFFQQVINEVKQSPIIIHYASPRKPWQILYFKMPYKCLWRKYKFKSQWWWLLPQLPHHKTFNYLVKRFLLWPFGINYSERFIQVPTVCCGKNK